MRNFERILTALGLVALLATGACSSSTGADADGTSTAGDASTGTDTTGTDATTQKAQYKAIVIFDKSEDPTFVNGKCGSSPGADIDAVALYRGGVLIGVGKPTTANYDTSKASTCDNKKNIVSSVEGPLDGHVYANSPDTGYLSLNGGSVELQFGKCAAGTDVLTCDGKGDLVAVQDGDEIDVYEVDTTYKASGGGPEKGNAYDGCVCYADEYVVNLRTDKGVDVGSIVVSTDKDGKPLAGSKTLAVKL
jgi:hypothetical protein